MHYRRTMLCALALAMPLGVAHADDIVTSWSSVQMPAPVALKPVTVDSAHTALLVLDFDTGNCNATQRPSCVASLPKIATLLQAARKHDMTVVYSTAPTGSIKSVPPELAPMAKEAVVHAGADKFLGTQLEAILKKKHITNLIVTGTIAQGAVLSTASEAALRGFKVIVPVDGMSSVEPFGELSTAWILANGPASVSKNVTVTRSDMIQFP